MDIVFTEEALDDLNVLHDFLQNNDVINAQDIIESLVLGIEIKRSSAYGISSTAA